MYWKWLLDNIGIPWEIEENCGAGETAQLEKGVVKIVKNVHLKFFCYLVFDVKMTGGHGMRTGSITPSPSPITYYNMGEIDIMSLQV